MSQAVLTPLGRTAARHTHQREGGQEAELRYSTTRWLVRPGSTRSNGRKKRKLHTHARDACADAAEVVWEAERGITPRGTTDHTPTFQDSLHTIGVNLWAVGHIGPVVLMHLACEVIKKPLQRYSTILKRIPLGIFCWLLLLCQYCERTMIKECNHYFRGCLLSFSL